MEMDPQQPVQPQVPQNREVMADTVATWILVALIFLLPVFFIPSGNVPFQFTKVMLMYVGVTASFIAWIIGRLKDGRLTFSRHGIFISLGAVVVTYLAASLFSPVRSVSLVGQGFEISTFSFIAAMVLFVFLVSNLFVNRKRTAMAYLAFLASFGVVALFQLARLLFGPGFFSLGVLGSATDNLVGSWNDLGVYFGAAALFAFITLELLVMQKMARIVCMIMLAVSLFFLTVINYTSVWYVLASIAFIFFIYNFSFNKSRLTQESPIHSTDGRRAVPVISLVVLIVSFAFILFKGNIYTTLSQDLGIGVFNRFAVSNIEVRPSWSSTMSVAKNSLVKNPLFGVGPNRFVNEWLQSKPVEINNTIFWSTDFNYGIGVIPTFLVTTGVIGSLAWIAFLVLFIYVGYRVLFVRAADTFASYVSISSFIIAFYFWLFTIFHVPSAPLLVLAFAFTGIFFASALAAGIMQQRSYEVMRDPKTSFVSVLVLIGILLGVVVFDYNIGRRYIASIYFTRALAAANTSGNVQAAETDIGRALRFSQDDLYYRTLAQLNLIKTNALLSQEGVAADILRSQFQTNLATAQAAVQTALSIDDTKYENWLAAGNVYTSVVPFNFDNAYEQALAAYRKARELNPSSPAIFLVLAQLEAAHNNNDGAKNNIAEAIKLKNNYTDAIYMLAQLQINQGDLKSAIKSVEALTYTNPNDAGVYFQLGLLRYNDKDYTGAASAFSQAINLVPDYANAKYFLGLSYSKQGNNKDAISIFEALAASNPDNAEVKLIVNNLKAGKDPFTGVQPPLDNAPEKRSNPPVDEEPADTTTPETSDR